MKIHYQLFRQTIFFISTKNFKKETGKLKLFNRKMENVTNIRFTDLPEESPYVKPFRLHYTQNGVEKNWDLIKVN